jgi:DNA-directed RNA polymerase subunit M/transcription elongation factor TFIIS
MKFCDKCGSYMQKTKNGFLCRKCGELIHVGAKIRTMDVEKRELSSPIHIIDSPRENSVKVSHVCPECGNTEAFRWFSRVSGEHAGIRRERTIEHFKCTKCSHSWTETS